mgnify:CR=1 FL=1
MIKGRYLLTDSQMYDFIVNGFITVKTDLPASFHQEVYARTTEVFDNEGNVGIRALISQQGVTRGTGPN